MSSELKANKISPATGTTITIGDSGDTVTLGSGASQSGFGSAAYAANASASTGAVNVDASDNLQFDSGYGSTATAYGCRAWVNFNGIGTVAIRDSGNVSSITDINTGRYLVNFTTAMPDINYCTVAETKYSGSGTAQQTRIGNDATYSNDVTTTSVRVDTLAGDASVFFDGIYVGVSVFR